MSVRNVFEQTYVLLKDLSVVENRAEFCTDWLGRNESYFRCLRYKNKQPSTHTIAVISNKLRHYSTLLKDSNNPTSVQVADKFAVLSAQFENHLHIQAKDTWLKAMEVSND